MRAAIDEGKAGARDELMGGRADEDLAGGGLGGDPRCHVHRDSTGHSLDSLDLAGVHPSSDHEAEFTDTSEDRSRTADGVRGTFERGHEPVPGHVDLLATME